MDGTSFVIGFCAFPVFVVGVCFLLWCVARVIDFIVQVSDFYSDYSEYSSFRHSLRKKD